MIREHRELAEVLRAARAAVVLSGYPSPLYDELYAGWDRVDLAARTNQGGTDNARTEVIWCNRPLGAHRSLFDLDDFPSQGNTSLSTTGGLPA